MEKSADAFRTISEVAEDLDLPQHVLRFWETRFTQIKPLKRAGGRRFYRPDDVELLRAVRQLLYGEGYTIKGVQKILKEQGAAAIIAASRMNGVPQRAPANAMAPMPAAVQANVGDASMLDFDMQDDDERLAPGCELPEGRQGARAYREVLPQQSIATMERLLADLIECQRILDVARRG